MHIVIHQHRPMLRRVRVIVDVFCNHLPQSRLLREPLAARANNRMPSYMHGAQPTTYRGLAWRNNVGLLSKANRMLDEELALQRLILTMTTRQPQKLASSSTWVLTGTSLRSLVLTGVLAAAPLAPTRTWRDKRGVVGWQRMLFRLDSLEASERSYLPQAIISSYCILCNHPR